MCTMLDWTNTPLRPGEQTLYWTHLSSERRMFQAAGPGQYTIRARWTLFGCTESDQGADCLTPLQDVHRADTAAKVDLQEPVVIESNEVTVESLPPGDANGLKFGFDVTVDAPAARRDPACTAANSEVECTVFHYAIHNLGDRPVRNATFTCGNDDIGPEYRFETGGWQPVRQAPMLCTANRLIETPILPGRAVEGTFTVRTLHPKFDTTVLQVPGVYQLRFTFLPAACIASPDGSFCLTRPEVQPSVVSKEITLRNPSPQPTPN
jgi:hypothetical protein